MLPLDDWGKVGLDYVTSGNDEFDLIKEELIVRMREWTFTWISSNVFGNGISQPITSSISYNVLTVEEVRILVIDSNILVSNKTYVRIIDQASLIAFVRQFLKALPDSQYDILIALTHLDLATDIQLSKNLPQIDIILDGHDHADSFLLRESSFTPIYKADGNAFTVYIHRCTFNMNTKRLRVYSTLTKIPSEVRDEPKT